MSHMSRKIAIERSPLPVFAGPAPASAAEVADLVNSIGTAFEQFKAANDERLKQIEKNGAAFPETVAKVDAINKEISDLSASLDEIAKNVGRLTAGGGGGNGGENAEAVNAARFLSLARGEIVEPAAVDLDEYRAYKRAFNAYLRRGEKAISADIRAALSVGSEPDGGQWVMPERSDMIIKRLFETSNMRGVAQVMTIGTDAYEMPTDTNDGTSGGWVGETATRSETNTPEVGMHRIPVHEQYAEPHITQKLLDDSQFDVETWLGNKIADKMVRTENDAFVNGNGVGKPKGFLAYGTGAVTTDDASRSWGLLQYVPAGAAGAFPAASGIPGAKDPDALITLVHKLNPAYRANARWSMNRATVGEVRKLKDGDGNYFWSMGNIQAGQPQSLLGYPIEEMEDMPDIAADTFSIAFGDFREGYLILDRLGITVLRDPFTKKGYVKFYTRKRVGGDVVNFDAIKLLKFAAS